MSLFARNSEQKRKHLLFQITNRDADKINQSGHLWLSTPIWSLWLRSLKKTPKNQETFRCLCPPTAVSRNFLPVQLWQIPARRAEPPPPAKSHAAKPKQRPCPSVGKRDPADVTGWGKQAFHRLSPRRDLLPSFWKRISIFTFLIVLIVFFFWQVCCCFIICLVWWGKKGSNKKETLSSVSQRELRPLVFMPLKFCIMQNSNLQCFLRIMCAFSLAINFPEMGRSSSIVHSKCALKNAVVSMSFFWCHEEN